MGMLFNTDATLEMLRRVNATFNDHGLAGIKGANAAAHWDTLFASLGTGGAPSSTHDFVTTNFGLDIDYGSAGATFHARNWKKFLDYIDSHVNTGVSTNNTVTDIGTAIANAINGAHTRIEFFAVPTEPPNTGSKVRATSHDHTDAAGDLTLIITINTCSVDRL